MSLRHAVLINLLQDEATGYDLAKCFDQGIGHFWNASHQQIYLELSKMAKEELVSFREEPQTGKPSKKIYSITKKGLKSLNVWMRQPIPDMPLKDTMAMKVYAGYLLPPEELLEEITTHRIQYETLLKEFKSLEKNTFANAETLPEPMQYTYLTLRKGILYCNARIEWTQEVEAFLTAKLK